MFKKKLLAIAISATLLSSAQNGFAGTASANLDYQVTLQSSCGVSVMGGTLGSYTTTGPMPTNIAAGDISVTCSNGLAYRVMVDGGVNPNASMRRMASGPNFVPYVLYNSTSGIAVGDANPLDPAYMAAHNAASWANGIDGLGTGLANMHSLKADMITTAAIAGNYTDSVGVTITW